MTDHILTYAKAYCALIGAALTALVASAPGVPAWVPVLAAICTAVATAQVPNKPHVVKDPTL